MTFATSSRVFSRNMEAFLRNNAERIERMHRQASAAYCQAFLLVPVLLHMNSPGLPGFVDNKETPFGARGIHDTQYLETGVKYFPEIAGEISRLGQEGQPVARSVFLIGSPGTVGYTGASDLDYWICLDLSSLSSDAWEAYRKKLESISTWAQKRLGVEVNFYPTDLQDLVNNTLRASHKETEGEVAPLVVKEELYRTLLHVTGSRPLWWGVPIGIKNLDYQEISRSLADAPLENEWDLIDLGYPLKPGPQEYLAAALWLSRKSEEDPFKGTLKLILILEQIESGFEAPQVCEFLKQRILTSAPESLPIDPYLLTIERVMVYADRNLPPKLVDLVRTAAFIKIRGPLDPSKGEMEDRKMGFLRKLALGWGWDTKRFERLNQYSSWPEQDRLALGQRIKDLLFVLYTRAARRLLAEYPDQVTPEDENLAEFKARILARYSDHQATVERLPSSLDRKALPPEITLVWTDRDWQLFGGLVELYQMGVKKSKGKMIFRAERAARVAGWLVYNHIFQPDSDMRFHLFAPQMGNDDFIRLVETLYDLFPPLDPKKVGKKRGWFQGGIGPRLLIANFETPDEKYLTGVDLIYRTNWGEMRHSTHLWKHLDDLAQRYQDVYNMIKESGGFQPEDINVFVHRNPVGRKIRNNLETIMAHKITRKQEHNGKSKGWLDIE